MSIFLKCSGCGKQLKSSNEHVGKQAQCPVCGALTVVPGEEDDVVAVVAEPVARRDNSSRRKAKQEEEQRCPECDERLPGDAVLCINCGYDFRTGERRRTVSRRLDRFWYAGLPLSWRLGILGGIAVVLLLICVPIMTKSPLIGVAIAFFGTLYPLLIFSIYATVRLHRTREGRTLIAKTWHVVFFPITTNEVSLKRYAAVVIEHTVGFGPLGLAVMLGLTCMGVIPGLIWWYWALTKNTFRVFLRGHRRDEELTLYRGGNADVVKDMADALQEVSDLPVER